VAGSSERQRRLRQRRRLRIKNGQPSSITEADEHLPPHNATVEEKQQFNQATEKMSYKYLAEDGDLIFRIKFFCVKPQTIAVATAVEKHIAVEEFTLVHRYLALGTGSVGRDWFPGNCDRTLACSFFVTRQLKKLTSAQPRTSTFRTTIDEDPAL